MSWATKNTFPKKIDIKFHSVGIFSIFGRQETAVRETLTYTKFTCRHLFVLYQETSRKVILDFIFTFDMIIQYKKIVFD